MGSNPTRGSSMIRGQSDLVFYLPFQAVFYCFHRGYYGEPNDSVELINGYGQPEFTTLNNLDSKSSKDKELA